MLPTQSPLDLHGFVETVEYVSVESIQHDLVLEAPWVLEHEARYGLKTRTLTFETETETAHCAVEVRCASTANAHRKTPMNQFSAVIASITGRPNPCATQPAKHKSIKTSFSKLVCAVSEFSVSYS
jgi:hypothetical protein